MHTDAIRNQAREVRARARSCPDLFSRRVNVKLATIIEDLATIIEDIPHAGGFINLTALEASEVEGRARAGDMNAVAHWLKSLFPQDSPLYMRACNLGERITRLQQMLVRHGVLQVPVPAPAGKS